MVTFKDALTTHRLVAIVRADDPRTAVTTLFEAGIRLVEISLTSPNALQTIADLAPDLPDDAWLGVGTIRTAADITDAKSAGATFAVSPATTPAVRTSIEADLPILAGVLTPTEVETALSYGATALKLFPASLGGVDYLKALRAPFPDVPFVPVGGVGVAEAVAYLQAGAIAVGVGSPLMGTSSSGLADRAKHLLDAIGNAT